MVRTADRVRRRRIGWTSRHVRPAIGLHAAGTSRQQEAGSVVGISVIRRLIGPTCTDHQPCPCAFLFNAIPLSLQSLASVPMFRGRRAVLSPGRPLSFYSARACRSCGVSFHGAFGVILTLFDAFLLSWHLVPISSRCTRFTPLLFLRMEPGSATAPPDASSRAAPHKPVAGSMAALVGTWRLCQSSRRPPSARPEATARLQKMN